MIFRSKKSDDSGAVASDPGTVEEMFEEIDARTHDNRSQPDVDVERRVLQLRHRAGLRLIDGPAGDPQYPTTSDGLATGSGVPEVTPGELSPELLRAAILRNGCLLIRNLVDREDAARLKDGIDRAFEARDRSGDSAYFEEFVPDDRFSLAAERGWVSDASGIWAADSPRVMVDVLDVFERTGLRRVATDYLGERPAISVNKCTLRRVRPDLFKASSYSGDEPKPSAWHQDGAFLGDVRALNVWLSLSRCGDVAPGLDLVPRRIEEILPTGTEGAVFDWSISHAVAQEAASEVGIERPIFEPGDVLLFDEMFLHSTAADARMQNDRYAVESWFFGPSAFPEDYAPLAF